MAKFSTLECSRKTCERIGPDLYTILEPTLTDQFRSERCEGTMRVTALGVWTHSFAGPTTSFYIEYENARILLDTGIDPINRMRTFGITPFSCSHLFISHLHSDHSSGFSNFVFTRELLGRATKDGAAPLTVFGAEAVLSGCKSLLALQYPDRKFRINWMVLPDRTEIELIGGVTATILPTVHSVECYACRLSSSGIDIGFTADTAPFEDMVGFFADCTVLIGEAFAPESAGGKDVNKRGHSTAEDLGRLVAACSPQWVIPFHFGPECAERSTRNKFLESCGGNSAVVIDPIASPTLSLGDSESFS